jgi:hypothetical protein
MCLCFIKQQPAMKSWGISFLTSALDETPTGNRIPVVQLVAIPDLIHFNTKSNKNTITVIIMRYGQEVISFTDAARGC